MEGRYLTYSVHRSPLNTLRSVFLYTEENVAHDAAHEFPLVLQHTIAIYKEFSLEISQVSSSLTADVPNDSSEIQHPFSPAGR